MLSKTTSIPSMRKQTEFKTLFGDIGEREVLVDCTSLESHPCLAFACALQREILAQGRMYLTDRRVCFYANIVGWVSNISINLSDILSVEKRSAALVIPNSILISTLHHRYFFASFVWREDAYEKICVFWKNMLSLAPKPTQELIDLARSMSGTVLKGGNHDSVFESEAPFVSRPFFAIESPLPMPRAEDQLTPGLEFLDRCTCRQHYPESLHESKGLDGSMSAYAPRLKSYKSLFRIPEPDFSRASQIDDAVFFETIFTRISKRQSFRCRLMRSILFDDSIQYI